jgi:hypothetical protein
MIFKFDVFYFKDSGKLYISESFELDVANVAPVGAPPVPYMQDAVDWLKKTDKKPGLQSGKWDGFMMVDSEEGYPCLIVPDDILTYVRSLKPI